MKFLAPCVTKAHATRFFAPRGFARLRGFLKRRPCPSATDRRRLPFTELVWLPHYLISMKVTSKHGPGDVAVSVEAYSGAFAIVTMEGEFLEGEPEGAVFHPKLDEQQAIRVGREELQKAIMRRRGQREKPLIEDTLGIELFYYPFWVHYYERRRGLLDIRVLDALTNEKAGAKTKSGILSAFIGADAHTKPAPDNWV